MKNHMEYMEYGLFGSDEDYASNWKYIINKCNEYDIKNYLNIGLGDAQGSPARKWNYFITTQCSSIEQVINLEIDPNFCQSVKKSSDSMVNEVINGDIRTFNTDNLDVDMVFWSHGPEHILRSEWEATFKKLEDFSNKVVILQVPWGSGYNYDPGHISPSIRKGELEFYGYECFYQGVEDTKNASLVGIKLVK
tara:strand:+ start:9222 stop:9800 length:579 start_codon:yes stop_codon:yes gene_type:complete